MPVQKPKLVPADDLENEFTSFEFKGENYLVKKKFKIARFLKTLNESPVDAIEIALASDSYDRFLDLEIDMDELKEFLECLSEAMSGSSLKN